MAKTIRKKHRPKDRPAIAEAIAKLRACDGFIMILDMPCSDRSAVEEAFRNGNRPPSELRVFASQEFQPASKTMRAMAEVLQGMWLRNNRNIVTREPPPIQKTQNISFVTDDDYRDGPISILAVEEEADGRRILHTCTSAITPEQARADHTALETWAKGRVAEIVEKCGWTEEDVTELVDLGLTELRKAWENEGKTD